MYSKTRLVVVAGLLLSLVCYAPASVRARGKEGEFAERVKTAVARLGTGTDVRVEVKLRDKTKLKGYVGSADESGFSLVDDRTNTATHIAYPQVKQMKGQNFSTGEKILLGVLIFLVITTVVGMVLEGA
ncbi:MAG TPA: hypothetical protein VGW12_15855 [Pyrinomonadaceae bacterium]|nr:hypothetical protein [Pyrinomonadaceae bacterium]